MSDAITDLDASEIAEAIKTKRLSPVEVTKAHLDRIDRLNGDYVAFITVAHDHVLAAAKKAESEIASGRYRGPLHGVPYGAKDIIDTAGILTTNGAPFFRDNIPKADAAVIEKLDAAGAVLLGKCNTHQFAAGSTTINATYGTARNPWDRERIVGGSSGGSACALAARMAPLTLGSDTGGSIRIPAALHGIVGFKSTQRLVPLDGTVPLSSTLDTVCAMTRSVRDAVLVHEILAARRVTRSQAPLSHYRLAVVPQLMCDDMDATVARAFERSLQTLRAAGARISELPLPALHELAGLQANGGFSAAESYAWHRHLLAERSARYDPRVLTRIQRGTAISAADYIDLQQARRNWITRIEQALQDFDAVLSPTVPVVAPPLAEVLPGAERDAAFFRLNGLLLRNPGVVNMLDGCALSLPCHLPDELPAGLMVWHGAMRDDAVLNISQQIEHLLRPQQP